MGRQLNFYQLFQQLTERIFQVVDTTKRLLPGLQLAMQIKMVLPDFYPVFRFFI